MNELKTDIAIVGGGIAGLWMLNSLSQQGYDVILLEADKLGCGQSVRSQGIIHGGMKYALNGVLSQASDAIKDMPARWRKCLAGEGDIDLSSVTQLSAAHYLWSQSSLGAKITSFFAKKTMSGRVDNVAKTDYPAIFDHSAFKGNLYKLNEIVLDIPTVLKTLAAPYQSRILKIDTAKCEWQQENQQINALYDPKQDLRISAQRFVFAAGQGNAAILKALDIEQPQMQLRPLHMLAVTHNTQLPVYAHCIGASSKPLVTITHHNNHDGSYTWYLGGDIAESGVERDTQQQIDTGKALIKDLLPWVTLENQSWQAIRIDRAEPKQSSLSRPDAAFMHCADNHFVCWPTKLALAPDLSDKVIAALKSQNVSSQFIADKQLLDNLQHSSTSMLAWEAAK